MYTEAIGENKTALIDEIMQNIDLDNIYKLFKDNKWTWWNIGVPSKATIATEIGKQLEYTYNRGVEYLQKKVKAYKKSHKNCTTETALKKVLDREGYTIAWTECGRFEYRYSIDREEEFREILEVRLVPIAEEVWSNSVNTINL